jgi:hypothetical protein
VSSDAYRRQLEDTEQSSLANQFLCRAMLDEAAGAGYDAARHILNAAWVCDDDGREDAARRCRSRAADLLESEVASGGSTSAELALQRVDLLRRAGRLDDARAVLAEARYQETGHVTVGDVIAFEEILVARGDTSCYTVAEAVEQAEATRAAAFLREAQREGLAELEAVLRALRHQDPGLRRWAVSRREVVRDAARAGRLSAEQVDVLAQAVRQPDTAWRAAEVLAEAGLATDRLLEAVGADVTASPGPRFFIEDIAEVLLPFAVSMARGAGAVEAARHAAGSAHPRVKELANRILQASEDSPEFIALCEELRSPQARMRAAAVVKLHRTEKPGALELVKRSLREDPAPEVRRDAAMRLGLRWDQGVARCLLDALRSEADEATRPIIAQALKYQFEMHESLQDQAERADLRAQIAALAKRERPGMVASLLKDCLVDRGYYR